MIYFPCQSVYQPALFIIAAYQLQFGTVVTTHDQPGHINLAWVNTPLFRGSGAGDGSEDQAVYTLYFIGKDNLGHVRVNISKIHKAPRINSEFPVTNVKTL